MADWRENLVESREGIASILAETKRIAVLGIKTEGQRGQAAFYVPEYMAEAGYEIVPVPVYYPDVVEILGEPVYRTLAEIPEPIDIVDVFRRAEDTPAIADEAVKIGAKVLWLQAGIVNDDAAARAEAGGLAVVMDACIGATHSMLQVAKKAS